MATLVPFRALRPPPVLAARVASPPYDVISTQEARALAAGNPESFLHVSRPEIDLAESVNEHAEEVYRQGRAALRSFVAGGILRADPEKRLYVYSQRMGGHEQAGIVACASVDEYERGQIRKHEKTRADKEDDRRRHIEALEAHDEPVFLTYRARPPIDGLVAEVRKAAPEVDLVTADQVSHTLWVVPPGLEGEMLALFAEVPALYVADGHHRSAAAARVHATRRGQPGEHDVFLAVVFPHNQMQILPYNRLVRDPRQRRPEALLAELRRGMEVEPASQPRPEAPLSFGVFLGGRWWTARARPGSYDPEDPVAALDCSIAQDQILGPIFGIRDPRTSKDVDFVGGIRGQAELERRVAAEGWSIALSLFPTRMDQLMSVSDAGKLMPPKSTWFEPKLRSGLFVHPF
ncbi:MAG TPA: DUF1015 family protein [Anaeromyxobacter sp.]|nr:DUF1015 family protein [Anaeromyxobacter sp.]